MAWILLRLSNYKQVAPLVRTGGSRHTGLAALPHRNIHYEYQALLGKYSCYEEDNLPIANALIGMGHVYRVEKRLWDIAALFYTKAAKIYKKINPVCDGYCDSIACLAIDNTTKVYLVSTLIDVMCSLKEAYPKQLILIGEKAINIIKNPKKVHVAEQYIYALMGEAYYKMNDEIEAREYLLKSMKNRIFPTSSYYKESAKILKEMPSLIE